MEAWSGLGVSAPGGIYNAEMSAGERTHRFKYTSESFGWFSMKAVQSLLHEAPGRFW